MSSARRAAEDEIYAGFRIWGCLDSGDGGKKGEKNAYAGNDLDVSSLKLTMQCKVGPKYKDQKNIYINNIGILSLKLSVWLIRNLSSLFLVRRPPPPVRTQAEQLLFHALVCFVELATYQLGA